MPDKISYLPGSRGAAQPPAGGDGMDTRLTKLETKIETILPTLATKGDVFEAKSDIIKFVAMAALAITTILIAVLAFMLNRAVPAQPMQQAPVVVVPVPANQPAPQSPPATKPGR